jgi:formylglycine-generating enzyme required for sulfatase activity
MSVLQTQPRYFSGKPVWMLPISAVLLIGGVLMLFLLRTNGESENVPTAVPIGTPTVQLPDLTAVTVNSAWTPFFQEFDGVEMALVPPGCFPNGEASESVCFENAFWIDRYEGTNAQFTALNGTGEFRSKFEGSELPRTNISWQEARTFCQSRGGGLPTADQWEYAARGPEGWLYPWGNTFDRARVIYGGLFDESERPSTVAVEARPNGASWVGAEQLLGNVREWVQDTEADTPILRGGSLMDQELNALTAHQFSSAAELQDYNGFRCIRE